MAQRSDGLVVFAALCIPPTPLNPRHRIVRRRKIDDFLPFGLGCPVGSVLCGPSEFIARARARQAWGYGAQEAFSNDELIAEKYRGIRPAPGYPAQPDHTEKGVLFELLDATKMAGIGLTEVVSGCLALLGNPDGSFAAGDPNRWQIFLHPWASPVMSCPP